MNYVANWLTVTEKSIECSLDPGSKSKHPLSPPGGQRQGFHVQNAQLP